MHIRLVAIVFTLLGTVAASAQPSLLERRASESLDAFANRIWGTASEPKITPTTWNGRAFLFVDYSIFRSIPKSTEQEEERVLVALEAMPGGKYRKVEVTVGEEEGAAAEIRAIGFANADKDPAKELIVLLSWPVQHYDVQGTQYEVRVFDDEKSDSSSKLKLMKSINDHFSKNSCDCERRGEKPEHFAFKTIATIKGELKRMGF